MYANKKDETTGDIIIQAVGADPQHIDDRGVTWTAPPSGQQGTCSYQKQNHGNQSKTVQRTNSLNAQALTETAVVS